MRARFEWLALLLAPALGFASAEPLPALKGAAYDVAKQQLIQAGWAPATGLKLDDNDYVAQAYVEEYGFTEVESCSGSGLLHCTFLFVQPKTGARLRLLTLGEGIPVVSQVERVAPVAAKGTAESTQVVDRYFEGLQENSRRLYDNMTTQYARYLYFLLRQNPADADQQINRFCYQQASQAQSQQAEVLGLMSRAGSNANAEVRSMLDSAETTRQKLAAAGKVRDVLLVDVATSTMMFAAYGRVVGERFTSLVANGCEKATTLAKAEKGNPASRLAYQTK